MRTLSDCNPIAVTVYFLLVSGIAMFSTHPMMTAISLLGALLYFFLRNGRKHGKSHLYFLGFFLLLALINPLVSHNGVTVLFVVNHNPITLEALLYGIASAAGMLSVLYWFRSFSQIMTRDKLLYVFGKLTPTLALVLSMAIRYAALFTEQTRKVIQSQKTLGLYKEDSIPDSIKGSIRVCSVMISWALENGIITADSMAARGYGIGSRTHFAKFRFRKADLLLLLAVLFLFGMTCAGLGMGALTFQFYPRIEAAEYSALTISSSISYAMLALLPSVLEIEETLKWKYFVSKI